MFKKLSTLSVTAVTCLMLAGCVSEGGYATYDRTYSRYDGPSYVYRNERPRRDWDRGRHYDRRDRDHRHDRRDDDRGGRRDWNRNDRPRFDDRGRDVRSEGRDGRSRRDGQVFIPNE